MGLWILPAVILGGSLLGCTSFHAVETTPEGINRSVEPGDTVRLATRDGSELTVLVFSVSDEDIEGRTRDAAADRVQVRFDRIETIAVERLDMKKAVLTTVVPALIAMAIACNQQECRTDAVVTSSR